MKKYHISYNPLQPRIPAGTSRGGQFTFSEVKMVKPDTPCIVRVNGKVVEQKGGEGSGHHGHAGRPGQVGGSAPSNITWITNVKDIVPGYPKEYQGELQPPSEEDRRIIEEAVAMAREIIPSLEPVDIVFNSKMHTPGSWGTASRRSGITGRPYLAISGKNIAASVQKRSQRELQEWTGMTEPVTYESLLEHCVTHELGHLWWNEHTRREKIYGTGSGGERVVTSVNVELDPVLKDWANVWKNNGKDFSGYAKEKGDPEEGFADSFANFVTGQNVPIGIEDWLWRNVK